MLLLKHALEKKNFLIIISNKLKNMNKALKILGIICVSIAVFLALIIIIALCASSDLANEAKENANNTSVSTSNSNKGNQYDLELLSLNCYTEYGYFHITGEVKNISGKSLESVEAVGTAYTGDGTFVKSDSALIKYNPVLVGQTSPFEVMMTSNPAIAKCNVNFKEFWGSSFNVKDER